MEQTWLELSFRLQPYLFHLLNFLTYYPYPIESSLHHRAIS